jgi:hypothetical protein
MLARDRRNLEPDIARAHDRDPRALVDVRPETQDVGDVAQIMHARKVGAFHGKLPHPRAGREDQGVVADARAVRELHFPRLPVNMAHPRIEADVHRLFLEIARLAQGDLVEIDVAREERLGKGGAFVGEIGLVPDENDPAFGVLGTQGLHRLRRRLPRPDNNDSFSHVSPPKPLFRIRSWCRPDGRMGTLED